MEYSMNTSKWRKLLLNVFNFFYHFFAIFLFRNSKGKNVVFKKDISAKNALPKKIILRNAKPFVKFPNGIVFFLINHNKKKVFHILFF